MWTTRNRQEFLKVIYSFLDKNFILHEIVLTIEYIRYPHTAENISDTLFVILDKWYLREKVHMITTVLTFSTLNQDHVTEDHAEG